MLQNTTKERLRSGDTVVGCFVRYADPALVEFLALQGWDFLVFDGEHGPLEPRDVENLARAAELRGVTPIARVTTNQPPVILRFLDAGVHGIHVPWINTAAEAADAVRAAKYHPQGNRGLAGVRAADFGQSEPLAEYVRRANDETLVVVHIETSQAAEQIDDYLAVDGIDVLFLGPTDLSHSLGVPGQTGHPDVQKALERVADAVVGSGTALGIFVRDADSAQRWHERGARYLATGVEGLLHAACADYLDRARTASVTRSER
jgi:4-hydroxy-2-oxoheptanedioate aldolase